MKLQVKIDGIKELGKNIDEIKKELFAALEKGTDEAAEYAAGIIRANAPYSRYKEAVTTKKLPRRENYPAVTMVGLSHNTAPDAHLTEYGTGPRYTSAGAYRGQMPAKPFFRQSIEQAKPGIKQRVNAAAKEPIDRRR